MTSIATVETVLGAVPADDLGIVLPHEHFPLLWSAGELDRADEQFAPPEGYRLRMEELYRQALRDAVACGARTLVEVTPVGMCRGLDMMRRLSRDCGIHVVASTGFYLQEKMPTWVKDRSQDELAELMVRELTDGIAESGVRPGMIKVSGAAELRQQEQKVYRAAATASRRTGAAITTHSCGGVQAHFDFLVHAGADPTRLYLGHADLVKDPGEYEHVARGGGHLIFTCWGIQHFVDQDLLAGRVAELADKGFASAVLLSIDYALCWSNDRMQLTSFEYECPYRTPGFLFRFALPKLREKGVSEDALRQMLVDNGRAMLVRPGAPAAAERPAAPAIAVRSGLQKREFSPQTRADFVRVANEYLGGWPYTKPLDDRLLDHWPTHPNFQPENVWIAYREGQPQAVLHGHLHERGGSAYLLGARTGAIEEARWLLEQFEAKVRAAGLKQLWGPHWASAQFYGGYVLGLEQGIPSWDSDGTGAFVEAGYRIDIRGVVMVCSLARPIELEPCPAGYEIVPPPPWEEFDATTLGYHAHFQGKKVAHCYCRLYPHLTAPRGGIVGQIGNVTTDEAHRGKGLARTLCKMCLRELQRLGASEALIATSLDNFPALRAYERAGFQRRYNINFWVKAWE